MQFNIQFNIGLDVISIEIDLNTIVSFNKISKRFSKLETYVNDRISIQNNNNNCLDILGDK